MKFLSFESTTQERCDLCRFWKADKEATSGACRKHAPSPRFTTKQERDEAVLAVLWPGMLATDWCGEFQKALTSARKDQP